MKKLSYFALMALLSTNLVAMAQTAPPSLPSFTLPTTTAPPSTPTQQNNQQQQQQQTTQQQTTQQQTTQQQTTQQPQSTSTGSTPTGSTSFDLGDLDDFGSGSSSGTQGSGSFAAPINFGAYPQQQQSYQAAPTFSGSMLQGNALGARGYTATAAPRQVAQTGPGALAALIPVAGYTLMTFRRREQ